MNSRNITKPVQNSAKISLFLAAPHLNPCRMEKNARCEIEKKWSEIEVYRSARVFSCHQFFRIYSKFITSA